MSPAEAVAAIRAMQPGPRPANYLDGYCALKFSDLAAWKGYEAAVRETEFIIRREVCPGCILETSYLAFLEAEKNLHSCLSNQ